LGVRRLGGKVAVVTGAGAGIGRGIARRLAAEGAAVCVSGRTLAKVEAVAAEIEHAGGRALAVECDVNDRGQVAAMVDATAEQLGPPDICVNNAQGGGSGVGPPLEDLTDTDVLTSFRGGPLATLYGMQACFPHMRDRGGTIVNMGSSTGVNGDRRFTAYGMAKEAIRGLTKHAANEWGRFGITVNVICPASMSDGAERFRAQHPDRWQAVVAEIPLGRMGDPFDDIAPTVVALATDLRYLTGATLMLDGGRCILR
jgi:NAD(P)-dependent dehydrogenase (short-subunit alcohol dehydrogenase family)